ncbi:MAG: transglutaminase family protein, partial [Cytophagales bacterium]
MGIKVAINHKTHYKYDRLVNLGPHVFRLRPAAHSRTKIESYSFKVSPDSHFINWQQDPFGNYQARLVFKEKTTELLVEVDIIADLEVFNPFEFFVEEYAEKFPFTYEPKLAEELVAYLKPAENGTLLTKWLETVDRSPKKIVDFLVYINQKLWKDINYTVRLEHGVQNCETTLGNALGSCRDTGWLLVQILRHLGLAARFVSGYLVQLTADIKALDGASGPDADFTDLHAWCEVYVPGAGWIGLDPTSGLFAGEGHIPLCCTPHYESAAPVSGVLDFCETVMDYANSVERIFEDPRVTKPYTEEQWAAILALGYKVDHDLEKNDVRMTMGGEPTFVSIDDMEAEEWNTGADGEQKRKLANELTIKLKEVFTKGGLLHYGLGKWYPGEPLPRWKNSIYWRKDGLPICHKPNTIADININYGFGTKEALKFSESLINTLDLDSKYIQPAYEDVLYYFWSEGKVPVNIDPTKKDIKESLERQFLADLLTKGLGEVTGYVIPLEWSHTENQWLSSIWKFRKNNLFLVPGNSPMGLRLPLDSIEKMEDESEREKPFEHDPMEILPSLDLYHQKASKKEKIPTKDKSNYIVRTALCIEPRDGRLHIFFPPIPLFENFLELYSAIETIADTLGYPIVLEGYEPPRDQRVECLVVTPDPGVIEVNIHPALNWSALTTNYEKLFEQARLSRLGTEKFMTDGRHTGTGGGNHVTIGAANAIDSPLLRRPDLLKSLITYWQHHPGLSYMFSGAFIGPTSQAPRFDEGRDDRLYEMEIALSQIPDHDKENVPYWLTDRLLRNLLVDLTGNTHRAEFCIDK